MGWASYKINLEDLRQPKVILGLIALGILGLILVLTPGVGIKVNGAKRWLGLGPVRLQVSEFSKIILTIVLSHYLAINQRFIKTFFRGFILPSGLVGVFCLLILMEPDFGTAFLCGVVGMSLIFLAGARLIYLVPSVLGAAVLFGVAISLDPVRLKRITSFLDVEGNRTDGAYQLWQGILAFAAGGIEGVGLGNGRQQWSFLPEAHTDFIFPIIGEELGLIFSVLVVMLFLFIFILGIVQLRRAPNLYQFSLASGCLWFITLQALINMGVVTGCLPTKGMSLPFISYGGSNLVVMFILVGLLMNAFSSWKKVVILEEPKEIWVS
jgi:cell division protein FtsW